MQTTSFLILSFAVAFGAQTCQYKEMGCFADIVPAPRVPPVRAVDKDPLITSNMSIVTVPWCVNRCAQLGFNFSGITGSVEQPLFTCYCGCAINDAAPSSPGACTETCPGAPGKNENCGSNGHEMVYQAVECTPPIVPASECPGGGGLPPGPACSQSAAKKWPFCNASLPMEERLDDLVNRISMRDAGNLLTARESSAIPELGLPPFYWGTNVIHGIMNNDKCFESPTLGWRCPTSFPQGLSMTCTFNRSHWKAVGAVLGREMRALANLNASQDGLTAWGPTINLIRDPRWGRNQETASESWLVAGEYGAYFSIGLQRGDEGGDNGPYLLAAATLKHVAAYSLEDYSPSGNFSQHTYTRQNFSAQVTAHDLEDAYLALFERAIRVGDSQGIMYSCSELNGVPGIDSAFLAGKLQDWGFNGYRTTDGGQIAQTVTDHHYVPTILDSIQLAMRDGISDIDDGGSYANSLLDALNQGYVNQSLIQRALKNTFRIRYRLGLFDDPSLSPATKLGIEAIQNERAQALNREVAQDAIVLLQNPSNILPFTSQGGATAVIGPLANNLDVLHGSYAPPNTCPPSGPCNAKTIFEAIDAHVQAAGGNATYYQGMETNAEGSPTLLAAAVAAARTADRVILQLGLQSFSPSMGGYEAEQHDRFNISLPAAQSQLALAILNVTIPRNIPTAIVLVHGGALAIDELTTQHVAIASAHYPGSMTGGDAVASMLFGDFSPSGALPYTTYPVSFQNASNFTDFSLTKSPGRTYRYYQGTPLFPFAHGLSYTSFSISFATSPPSTLTPTSTFTLDISITNTGSQWDAKQTVFLFVRPVNVPTLPSPFVPLKFLVNFDKVFLPKKASTTISFPVDVSSNLTMVDPSGTRKVFSGSYEFLVSTSTNSTITSPFTIQ